MEQTREMWAMNANYTQIKPLLTCLRVEMEEDMEAKQAELEAYLAKLDTEQEKRMADMKAFKEMMERRERLNEKPRRKRGWLNGKLKKKEGRLKEKPTSKRGWPSGS
jgi:hypothetical protein